MPMDEAPAEDGSIGPAPDLANSSARHAPPPPRGASLGRQKPPPALASGGLLSYVFPNGCQIRAYPNLNKYEALCSNPLHGRCVLTRTWLPPASRAALRNPFQGRPLGLLAYFCETCDSEGHRSHTQHLRCAPTFVERQAARARLKAKSGTETLFGLERARGDDEESEPEVCV